MDPAEFIKNVCRSSEIEDVFGLFLMLFAGSTEKWRPVIFSFFKKKKKKTQNDLCDNGVLMSNSDAGEVIVLIYLIFM